MTDERGNVESTAQRARRVREPQRADTIATGEPATLFLPDSRGGAGYADDVYDATVLLAESAGLDYAGGTIAALTVILTDGTQATVEMNRDALKRLADRVWTILFETYQYGPGRHRAG